MEHDIWADFPLAVPLLQWLFLWLILSTCLEFLVLRYYWRDEQHAIIFTSVFGNLIAFLMTIPFLIPFLSNMPLLYTVLHLKFSTIVWLAPLDVGFKVGQSGVINRLIVVALSLSLLYYSFPLLLSILIEDGISVIFKAPPEKRLIAVTGGKCTTYAIAFLSLFTIGLWQGLTNPIDESRGLLSYFEGWFMYVDILSWTYRIILGFFYLFVLFIVLPIILLVRFRPWRFIIRTIRENASKERVMPKNSENSVDSEEDNNSLTDDFSE